MVANLTVWETVEQLETFVWGTVHKQFYDRRQDWFEVLGDMHFVMWWVPEGHRPTLEEALTALLASGMLAGCGPDDDDILFDGQYFRAKVDTDRGSREDFTVSIRPVSASLLGAREAGRYEATVYCVNRYGSSAIEWVVGPDSPDEALTIRDDTLFLQGRCPT